ncbi:hypothetical protein SteCoe_30359 [Stentor coeruleus]|uniref:Uncharacterized protein n=1 Tax=Stentor coeruleus TaxID=5963 RepID=A0A1R2B430_9CILI|nr:hypothetical protein SteCoe_30359 [Stentor coeruleus]
METTLVPCNSLAEIDTAVSSTQCSPITKANTSAGNSERKQRVSFSDVEIINNCMSPEKRKTLMLTEHSNFKFLTKMKTSRYPKKKFKALAPSEYEKYVIELYKVQTSNTDFITYNYPSDILGSKQLKEIKTLHQEEFSKIKIKEFKLPKKTKKSTACEIF